LSLAILGVVHSSLSVPYHCPNVTSRSARAFRRCGVSTGSGGASANGQAAVCGQRVLSENPVMFMVPPQAAVRSRFADFPLALKSILGFWFFYFLTVVARAFLGRDPGTVLENKSMTIAAGVILTF